MALSLHTTRIYKVEYGTSAIKGWDTIREFINFLHEKQQEDIDGIWMSGDYDEVENIEIDFGTLELLKDDEVWGDTIKTIIENSDKSNNYVRLEIF